MKPQLKSCGNSETTVALAWETPENPRHQLEWLNPLLVQLIIYKVVESTCTPWETLKPRSKKTQVVQATALHPLL